MSKNGGAFEHQSFEKNKNQTMRQLSIQGYSTKPKETMIS